MLCVIVLTAGLQRKLKSGFWIRFGPSLRTDKSEFGFSRECFSGVLSVHCVYLTSQPALLCAGYTDVSLGGV